MKRSQGDLWFGEDAAFGNEGDYALCTVAEQPEFTLNHADLYAMLDTMPWNWFKISYEEF